MGISVFPNPSSGLLHLDLNLEQSKNLNLQIFSITGQLEFNSQVYQLEKGNHLLTQEVDLPNGMYILVLKEGDELIYHQKLQIAR